MPTEELLLEKSNKNDHALNFTIEVFSQEEIGISKKMHDFGTKCFILKKSGGGRQLRTGRGYCTATHPPESSGRSPNPSPSPASASASSSRNGAGSKRKGVEEGLITMQDVEMAVADGTLKDANKPSVKFPMKKSSKLKVKQLKKTGKNKRNSKKSAAKASVDTMVE
ncbi:Uncharacterized protein Adt_14737 [Abeliophyllum distichum]|uniref:Uncharacterized protein n=1 Tax=Abeliophyllum distichum TaxID=126358 RepID=A0ABD1U0I3_9LAMI